MTAKKFTDTLGIISEKYIEEAVTYTAKERGNPWNKWIAMAACLCLLVTGTVTLPMFRQAPGGIVDPPNASEYPYNDEDVLDYIGMPLDDIQTDAGKIILNEITDMEAYRSFNTRYDLEGNPYYSTRITAFSLLTEYPVSNPKEVIDISVFEKDGRVENCPQYDQLLLLGQKAPIATELIMQIFAQGDTDYADVYYNECIDTYGISFYPEGNCVASLVVGEDIAAIDERFERILPILQGSLGTKNTSYMDGQEISVHYFYQNRLFLDSKTEEAYQYYVYFERGGLQYLYQFSSNWALVGKNVSAIHHPPHTLHYVKTQEECRELFAEYLLTVLSVS